MTKLILNKPLSPQTQEKLARLSGEAINPKDKVKEASSTIPQKPSQNKSAQLKQTPAPLSEELAQQSRQKLEAAVKWLESTFPKVFTFSAPVPLKLRINRDVMPHVPATITKHQAIKALRVFINTRAYRESLLAHSQRFDLNGQPMGKVTDEHREHARKKLASAELT
jgi:hypothetical protein